ncbi:MAG: ribonuclease III [Beijerinckiaceae bacterium]
MGRLALAVDGALEPDVPAGALSLPGRKTVARDRQSLESAIGYSFADATLLEQALTHATATRPKAPANYQRLEFLGDRVLGLAVAEMLFEAFPKANEGELSRRLSDLVRRETCAEVAREWGAVGHIRLGGSEASSGGASRGAILADVCEALIGAAFLDGGFAAAQALVRRGFGDRMRATPRPVADPKTALQEWAQARGLPPPSYREEARSGPDHAPLFTIRVEVGGFAGIAADAGSKRAAEQSAAEAFLIREGVLVRAAARVSGDAEEPRSGVSKHGRARVAADILQDASSEHPSR